MASSRLEQAIGTIDGVNRDFRTPTYYRAGSLVVFLNGQQLKRQLDNGWDEVDQSLGTFRMKVAPRGPRPGSVDDPGDVLFVYFDTEASTSTGGADGGVPEVLALDVLTPRLRDGDNLRPRLVDAEDADVDPGRPLPSAAEEVRPDVKTTCALRPKMAGAEEV
jgi:hypothetical protein